MDRYKPFIFPLAIIILAAFFYQSRIRREMVDFGVYRTAALRVRAAEPLYRVEDGHYQFKYLPAFAVAMIPFSMVDPEAAKVIWFALTVGLLTAYVRWTVRALPERRRSDRVLVVITVLLMAKFYAHELTLGQSNILLGTLLVAALLAVQIDQPGLAGALIGVAAFVKPYALMLLPWIALTYGIGAAAGCLVVVATGLVLPALIYGWSGNLELLSGWVRTVTTSTAPNLTGNDNISFAAMWAKWLGPGTTATMLAAATSAASVGLATAVWLRRQRVDVPDYLEFALLMLFVPLLSPQGWDYVLLLGTPAVVCLLDRWDELGTGWRVCAGTALALMGLTIFDVMGRDLYSHFMALSIVSVAAIGVASTLAHLRWKALA